MDSRHRNIPSLDIIAITLSLVFVAVFVLSPSAFGESQKRREGNCKVKLVKEAGASIMISFDADDRETCIRATEEKDVQATYIEGQRPKKNAKK